MKKTSAFLTIAFVSLFATIFSGGKSFANEPFDCLNHDVTVPANEVFKPVRICEENNIQINFEQGVSLVAPQVGTATIFKLYSQDGNENEYSAEVNLEHILSVNQVHTSPEEDALDATFLSQTTLMTDDLLASGPGDPGCSYGTYSVMGVRWNSNFYWYYDPRNQSSSRAIYRLRDAIALWQYPVNRCTGESFSTNFKATYMGSTTAKTSLVGATSCSKSYDGFNLVSWKDLGPLTLGATCINVDSSLRYITEADIALNSVFKDSFYDYQDPAGCPIMEYFLINTAAHEFGHALGLDHVYSWMHQVMSSSPYYCLSERIGLGPGDYNGLMQIYGLDHSNVPV